MSVRVVVPIPTPAVVQAPATFFTSPLIVLSTAPPPEKSVIVPTTPAAALILKTVPIPVAGAVNAKATLLVT